MTMAFNPASLDYNVTGGYWATETESARAFDDIVEGLGLFRVHREVEGRYQFFRPAQEFKTPRIDRILIPEPALREAGWTLGPIGVELKASGKKLGPELCQLIDYSRAAYRISSTWIVPEWFFLWPCNKLTGPLQSVISGQRCGGAFLDQYQQLVFHSAFILAKLSLAATDVRPDNTNHGRKVGSR